MTAQTWILLWSTGLKDPRGHWVADTIIDNWTTHETYDDALDHYLKLVEGESGELYTAHVAMVVDGDGSYDTQLWDRCLRLLTAADATLT